MKARIRDLMRSVPFQPFVIRIADGREYRIEHPDFILASSKNPSEIIIEEEHRDRVHFVSALLITSVEKVSDANLPA
jgi:hypothetical protein